MVKAAIPSQVLNGVLLPVVLVFMLRLINKHELMGEHTNSHWLNAVAWGTAAIVIGPSGVLMWDGLVGYASRQKNRAHQSPRRRKVSWSMAVTEL